MASSTARTDSFDGLPSADGETAARLFATEPRLRNPLLLPTPEYGGAASSLSAMLDIYQLAAERLSSRYGLGLPAAAAYARDARECLDARALPPGDEYFPAALLAPGLDRPEAIATLAERLFLRERHALFSAQHALLRSAVASGELGGVAGGGRRLGHSAQLTVTHLLAHTRVREEGGREVVTSAVGYLLDAVRALSREVGEASKAGKEGAWRAAAAISHRAIAARSIYLASTLVQLSVGPRGNAHVAGTTHGAGAPSFETYEGLGQPLAGLKSCASVKDLRAAGAPSGWAPSPAGEMGALVEAIRDVSETLWLSCEGEASPEWEVTSFLLMALLQAADHRMARLDPDTGRVGRYGAWAAGATWGGATPLAALLTRLHVWVSDASPVTSELSLLLPTLSSATGGGDLAHFVQKGSSVYWAHAPMQGVVQLACATWLSGLLRNQLHAAPTLPRAIAALIAAGTAPQRRGITTIARLLTSPTLVYSSDARLKGDAGVVPLLHAFAAEVVHLDRTLDRARDRSFSAGEEGEPGFSHASALERPSVRTRLAWTTAASRGMQGGAVARVTRSLAVERAQGQMQVSRVGEVGDRPMWRLARLCTSEGVLSGGGERTETSCIVEPGSLKLLSVERRTQLTDNRGGPGRGGPLSAEAEAEAGGAGYAVIARPAAPLRSDLPDCLEDLLALQAALVRGLPPLARRYWGTGCAQVGGEGEGGDELTEDGLDGRAYVGAVCAALTTDLSAALGDEAEGSHAEVLVLDAAEVRGGAAAPHSSALTLGRAFLATTMDFLGALGSGGRCADGRECMQHLAAMLTDAACPPALSLTGGAPRSREEGSAGGLLAGLLTAAGAVDPEQARLAAEAWRDAHAAWRERKAAEEAHDPLFEYLPSFDEGEGAGAGLGEEPRQPERRVPHAPTMAARLRLLAVLCGEPSVRDAVCAATVPDRSLADVGSAGRESAPDMYATPSRDGTLSLHGGGGRAQSTAVVARPKEGASVTAPALLLRLLGLPLPLAVKAALFTALSVMATASVPLAAAIRDGIESAQVLRTVSSGSDPSRPGPSLEALEAEHEGVEMQERDYGVTLAFTELVRVIHAQVPCASLGPQLRQPGLHPHVAFALRVLTGHARAPTAPEKAADTWKLAFASLGLLYDVLRAHAVHFPASPEAVAAVAAAGGGAASVLRLANDAPPAVAPPLCLVDAPGRLPPSARRTDAEGTYLYALEVTRPGPHASFRATLAAVASALGEPSATLRLASVPEINHFTAASRAAGGRFRGWTRAAGAGGGESAAAWYDQAASPRAMCVPPSPVSSTARVLWLLHRGTIGAPAGVEVLVEVPALVGGTTDEEAAGYVAGDPRFDFVTLPLPPLRVLRQGGVSASLPSPRSVGFDLLRTLLGGGAALGAIIRVIAQAGPGVGGGAPRGAASLEAAYASLTDSGSAGAVAALADSLLKRSSGNGDVDILAPSSASPSVAGSGVAADMAAAQAEGRGGEEAAVCVAAAAWSLPGRADSAVLWREKAVAVALALLDVALGLDGDFLAGARAIRLPDPISSLPELLHAGGALPFILRAAGYAADYRVGLLGSRVLYRLVGRPNDLPPVAFGSSLLGCGLTFDESGRGASEAVAACLAACLADDTGSDAEDCAAVELDAARRAEAARAVATRLGAAVEGGEGSAEVDAWAPVHGGLDRTLVALAPPAAAAAPSAALRPMTSLVPAELLAVRVGDVVLPISVLDGPCSAPARGGRGWASPPAYGNVGSRYDWAAQEARRATLGLALLKAVEGTGGRLTIGHILLGFRAGAGERLASAGSPPLPPTHVLSSYPSSALEALVSALGTVGAGRDGRTSFVARRPHAGGIAARIVATLLSRPDTAVAVRALLTSARLTGGSGQSDAPFLAAVLLSLPRPGHGTSDRRGGTPGGQLVSPSLARASQYALALGSLSSALAASLHAASTAALPDTAFLTATRAALLPSPLVALLSGSGLGRAGDHPGPPPDALWEAVALLPSLTGGAGSRARAGVPDPSFGPVVSITGEGTAAGVQLFSPPLLRLLMAALARKQAGTGTGTAASAAASAADSASVLAWAARHNAYVSSLRGTYGYVTGTARLATTLLAHTLPYPDPSAHGRVSRAGAQVPEAAYFGERLAEVTSLLAAGAAAGAPSLLLVPLLPITSLLLAKLRLYTPSVRLEGPQVGRFTAAIAAALLARDPAAPGVAALDVPSSPDGSAAATLRSSLRLLLLDVIAYAEGEHPSGDARTAALRSGGEEAAPLGLLGAPALPAAYIEASRAGVWGALRGSSEALARAAVADVCAGPAGYRSTAAVLLTRLLGPSARQEGVAADVLSVLSSGGRLGRLIVAASEVDVQARKEEEARAREEAERGREGGATKRPRPADGDLPGSSGSGGPSQDLATAYAVTFGLLCALAEGSGARALADAGAFALLGSLSWPSALTDRLAVTLSRSLGLHGTRVDELVTSALAQAAPMLLPVLHLLAALARGLPSDRSVGASAFSWTRTHSRLAELIVQAALSDSLPLPVLSLARALMAVLSAAAELPGVMEAAGGEGGDARAAVPLAAGGAADVLPPSPLVASSADRLALSLLQCFALQPRAQPDALEQAGTNGGGRVSGMDALKERLLGASASNAAVQGRATARHWVSCLLPSSKAEAAEDAPLPLDSLARIGTVTAVSPFRIAGVRAGEELAGEVVRYLLLRSAGGLAPAVVQAAVARPATVQSAGGAAPPARPGTPLVTLFWPTGRATPDVVRLSTTRPSIRVLADAVGEAARALVHASRQGQAAEAAASRLPDVAVPGAGHPSTTLALSRASYATLARTLEQLLTLWLGQAAGDAALRADAGARGDLAALKGLPAVRAGLEAASSDGFLAGVLETLTAVIA